MKAKKKPTHHKSTDNQYIQTLVFRNLAHAIACAESIGHEAFLDRQSVAPAIRTIAPEIPNVQILYFDNATSQGALPTSPARAAPAPSVTSNAGRAQQTSVPADVSRLSAGRMPSFTP